MNDFEAMEAINEVLERYFRADLSHYNALAQIAQISGANKISHEFAAGQQ